MKNFPRGYIVAAAVAATSSAYACHLGDPPSCWTGISNSDISDAAKKGVEMFSRALGGKGNNSLREGPGERTTEIKITDKDVKSFWDFYGPQVIQPTGRFINRE